LHGREPGQVRKEAATAILCKCRGNGSPPPLRSSQRFRSGLDTLFEASRGRSCTDAYTARPRLARVASQADLTANRQRFVPSLQIE
jgi:hypothetical protein